MRSVEPRHQRMNNLWLFVTAINVYSIQYKNVGPGEGMEWTKNYPGEFRDALWVISRCELGHLGSSYQIIRQESRL